MNYGVGGIIATHADTGTNTTITENPMYGGRRLMTFMMYLTDVELGGNTSSHMLDYQSNLLVEWHYFGLTLIPIWNSLDHKVFIWDVQ